MAELKEVTGEDGGAEKIPLTAQGQPDVIRYIGEHYLTPKGKLVLELLKNQFYHRISHSKDNTSEHTAFLEGERSAIAFIMNSKAHAVSTIKKGVK